ncbi:MAG: galactokinase [Chitinophagales bacterium]|nr:galactokinase [Chitinophagales bacterium]
MSKAVKKYFAPGRVNLIGEHIDYNGGLVLPAALNIGISATYIPQSDNKIVLRSATHSLVKEINLSDTFSFNPQNDWTNYPIGIIEHLKRENHYIPSCEVIFESNLPEGSGLSSSAAIEVLTAFMLLSQTESNINRTWLAEFCQQVENEFIDVKCGIMDQYAVANGKKDNALLLDCAYLKHDFVPIELGDCRLLLMNTNKPRSLIRSRYNERKAECEEALRIIRNVKPQLKNLCEAEMHWIETITDEVIRKRARHVISENIRVKESVKVLRHNDLHTFGRLLNASHQSLKEDYEVSGTELDILVETAQEIKGCLGARMTGAGFGGCAIALVHHSVIEKLKNNVSETYFNSTGITCSFHTVEIGDGVRLLSE